MDDEAAAGKDPRPARVFPPRLLRLLVLFLVLCCTFSAISIYMVKYFGVSTAGLIAPPAALFPCNPDGVNGLARWVNPPPDLMHGMSDAELIWRASMAPRVKNYPFERVPKVAFMFLAKGPLPLAPLWERFFKGHAGRYSIYVHSLPSFVPGFRSTSVFYGRQIPSQVAEWGRMSMCDAEKRLLANALLDISNERFVLLSESCIPLYNFTMIYNHLMGSRYSFMGAFDDPGPYGRGRYDPNMLPEVKITQWRKGSQWFEVNRRLALYIIEDNKYYPKFSEFCRPACYVDEHYFPTMLTIRAGGSLANRSVTWVDWSRGGAHPATFGKSDITEAFMKRMLKGHSCSYNNKPSSVCFLFARKFSPNTLEALFWLAPKYFGY